MFKHRKNKTSLPISGVIILAAVLLCGIGNGALWYVKSAEINDLTERTKEFVEKSDQQIAVIAVRKAEEKLMQEAAAKHAAEQAVTGDGLIAGAIDSKACNTASSHAVPSSIDVVVNKKHCIQPVTYVPSDLVDINGVTLSAKAAEAFIQLSTAAADAGLPFNVTSSYRSYEGQLATYNYWVSVSGREGADTYSARPGYSEHQTGFVFDVAAGGCVLDCFGSTPQYGWLLQHAADYGFIQRYFKGSEAITGYNAEEWHYRYVGKTVAKDMRAKNIKTLEEYWGVSGGNY